MAQRNPPWTRDELILALELYFRVNPLHTSEKHPDIQALSNVLNALPIHTERPDASRFRNPNGVYMKLCNFLRLDDSYTGTGLDAGSKRDAEVWNEFAHDRPRLTAVAEAIRAQVQADDQTPLPPTPDESEYEAPEGTVLLRQHKVRERNSALVREKKKRTLKKFGYLQCEACDFIFTQLYGSLGDEYIECHHTIPLSQLRPGDTTHIDDLALVCANCHRMLHRGGELLSIAQLRAIVQQHRLSANILTH